MPGPLAGGPVGMMPGAAPVGGAPAGGGNPYAMQGTLPFQAGGNPFGGDLAGAYQSSYNSALAQNQALYQNILGGYNQTMANQRANQGSIQQRYDNLGGQVMGTINDITASQRQAIQDVYAQQQGSTQQSLLNRGLGNATVADSMSRGLTLDEQKAQIALANQQAQLSAGYQAQLGSAAAGYANQSTMQNTALAGQELNWMNTVQAQYPNAQSYGQLQYNQGLMNALQSRAGLQGAGLGGYGGGGGTPMHPIAPPNMPRGANPFDYGFGGNLGTADGSQYGLAYNPASYGQSQTLSPMDQSQGYPDLYPGEGEQPDPYANLAARGAALGPLSGGAPSYQYSGGYDPNLSLAAYGSGDYSD